MRPLRSLTIVYDADCGFCAVVKDWMAAQPALLRVAFVAAGSEQTRRRFPQLPPGELAVVGDTGEVWLGNHAWIVCLWALRDYRDWAVRLSGRLLLPLARQAFAAISRNRAAMSDAFAYLSDYRLKNLLKEVAAPSCERAGQNRIDESAVNLR
jgi:predicted DCC family thiol-disulfide oxidoreductase YuxK